MTTSEKCLGQLKVTSNSRLSFWAKTDSDGNPGTTVRDHCINVGCVAEALLGALPDTVRPLLPPGAATLAALHDAGKISLGFQVKCAAWIARNGLTETAVRERWASPQQAESDHAKITQAFLQAAMKPLGGASADRRGRE
ncbi:MAG: HD domain-containing protein [Verrucomicrobiales bacterium]